MFKTAVDARVQSVKSSVDQQVGELRSKVDELKAAAEAAFSRNVQAQVPISGFKEEVAGLNAAVNGIKAEFNVFDPVKLFGLQDKYDEWFLNRFRSEEKRKEARDQKPENLLAEVNKAKEEIAKAKNRLTTLEGRLDKPKSLSELRKDVTENHAWAKDQIKDLRGRKKNPRDDIPSVRRNTPDPNLRQLHQQERQLRATIAHFVRVVKGAVPEAAALSREMAHIERELKK
ncbi:hypothetical protein ACFXPN_13530 [Streptomyces griseorubiginosus]|uniref:hypothetical protein n=1 Tax=Streptomyces griseorubiginosus TaxID=67304 RepID=UPI0036C47FB9